jgi:rubrerythrin
MSSVEWFKFEDFVVVEKHESKILPGRELAPEHHFVCPRCGHVYEGLLPVISEGHMFTEHGESCPECQLNFARIFSGDLRPKRPDGYNLAVWD